MSLSTHVLDASTGQPAAGVHVELREAGRPQPVDTATTDADGRVADLGAPGPGTYVLVFATGDYFRARGVATFYPEVQVTFEVVDAAAHHHVPLLLSPYSYSTYRGS